MLSRAYYTHCFVEHCPELHDWFIDMAKAMGKTDAKEPMDFVTILADSEGLRGRAEDVRPRHYAGGVLKFVRDNARAPWVPFKLDRLKLTDEDLVKIYTESHR